MKKAVFFDLFFTFAEHLLRRDETERRRIGAWADFRLERFSDLPQILCAL